MKKVILSTGISILLLLFMAGCTNKIENKITFQNYASNTIYINFRATLITVEAGKSVEVTEVPRGEYSYDTTFEVPSGTSTSKTEGAVSGTVILNVATKILIVYSSTFIEGTYTLGATLTSSEDISGGGSDPVTP